MAAATGRPGAAAAAFFYLAATLVFTWPLAPGVVRDIPWDLGDSLLNCWILSWDADHLVRFLGGDLHALAGFWSANIFYPEPLTLAYSEHLLAQAVQILPIYALTHNIILCYNLLFLSTFVLSGLGTYLFVREITGNARAALLAGTLYAFAPLRVPQFAHLQVISSQWMPFVLYGLRRYFDSRRIRPLAGAGAALVAQNLSCGYFLLFFAPMVAAYVVFEVASRRAWNERRLWLSLAGWAAAVTVITLPFLMPYLELRRLGFPPRAYTEVSSYSADVYSYWTAPAESRLWGNSIRAYPKPEGDLFPSLVLLALTGIAAAASVRQAWSGTSAGAPLPRSRRIAAYGLAAAALLYAGLVVIILSGHGFARIGPLRLHVRSLSRNVESLSLILFALMAVSPRARAFAARWAGSLTGFALIAALTAFVLSLGPEIHVRGGVQGLGPYAFFYWQVPGFDGLRVPARYGMIVVLFLAIAGGSAAASLDRRLRRGKVLIGVLIGIAVLESIAAPITLNGTEPGNEYTKRPEPVSLGDGAPRVYRYLGTLPRPAVIAEFPLGDWAYELRYMFYSTIHWHPLINGYSGTVPLSYHLRAMVLDRPEENPGAAWQALASSGATHAVVHEGAYTNRQGAAIVQWLTSHGAHLVAEFGSDKVLALR